MASGLSDDRWPTVDWRNLSPFQTFSYQIDLVNTEARVICLGTESFDVLCQGGGDADMRSLRHSLLCSVWQVVVLLPLVAMVLVHILHLTGFCSSSLWNPNHCQMTVLMLFFFGTKTSISISITYSLHPPDTTTRMRAVGFWIGGGVYYVLQEERVRGKCLEKYILFKTFTWQFLAYLMVGILSLNTSHLEQAKIEYIRYIVHPNSEHFTSNKSIFPIYSHIHRLDDKTV